MLKTEHDFSRNRRVTATIWYYKPRTSIESGPLIIPSELIGQKPTVVAHSGLLQSFLFQTDDVKDEETEAWWKFRSMMFDFKVSVNSMTVEERRALLAEYAASNPEIAVLLPVVKDMNGNDVPFVPDPKKISPEETLKALVPYPELRKFLQFWQKNITAGPLHSVEYAGHKLIAPYSIKSGASYILN